VENVFTLTQIISVQGYGDIVCNALWVRTETRSSATAEIARDAGVGAHRA